MICHHFCCILCAGCESLVLAHTQGRGSHRWEPGDMDSWDRLTRLLNTPDLHCFTFKFFTFKNWVLHSHIPHPPRLLLRLLIWICKARLAETGEQLVNDTEYFSPRKASPLSTTCRIPGNSWLWKGKWNGGRWLPGCLPLQCAVLFSQVLDSHFFCFWGFCFYSFYVYK